MTCVFRSGVVLLFLCVAMAGRAYADPIVITSGSTFLPWDREGTSITLAGEGFSVVTEGAGGGVFVLPSGPASIDGTLTFASFGGSGTHTWRVTVDGTQYDAFLSGSLFFDAVPVVIPPATTGSHLTINAPFTASGRLLGTTAALGMGSVLFDVLLTGQGRANLEADAVDTNLFRTGGMFYEFAAPPPEVPEPATVLLMGTGLAGVLLRRRRTAS